MILGTMIPSELLFYSKCNKYVHILGALPSYVSISCCLCMFSYFFNIVIKLMRGGHFCSKFENMVRDEFAICRNNLVSESIVALTPNNGHTNLFARR